ncbi:MAG TPA: adenosylmethionine decarboxylase [Anaerolineae bacterium]|nr:adenosylmethionine decarboxylase [Anaerolineae bacterium]
MNERLALPAALTAADVLATAANAPRLLGSHIFFDAYDCASPLPSLEKFQAVAEQLAALAGGEILAVQHHCFTPHGLTLTAILSASHLAIHTWPEHRFIAIDVFTCSPDHDFEAMADYLKSALGCARLVQRQAPRGHALASHRAG